ncbi:hypothetical protein AwDysgo_11130 [Bacteroidales bacterium]|nr:hypothetical protein AwDysgo_11130 [Bacteroidales bacterium]
MGLTSSCVDYDALNENPNKPTSDMYDFNEASLGTTLRYGIDLNFADATGSLVGSAHLHERIKNLNIDFYSQYINPSAGWTTRNYLPNDSWNSDLWKAHFQWLSALNTIINDGDGLVMSQNNVQIARVWRVYIQSQASDFFGPMPFPLVAAENPDYIALDKQYEIFFLELDDAVKKMDANLHVIAGVNDPIYFGVLAYWQSFANSLRLRLAMKLSEVDTQTCSKEAINAINAPGGLMTSGNDARISGTSGWGNAYNYYMYQVSWGEKMSLTTSFEKILTGIGGLAYNGTATIHPEKIDPRGVKFFDPSVDGNAWKGVYPGLNAENHVNVGKNHAFMSEKYILPNEKRKVDCFLYEEVCFLLAEAYERNIISGGTALAREWYDKGVISSFGRWDESANVEAYLASTEPNSWGTSAHYDSNNGDGNSKLEKIITQKYIANYPDVSYQAWNDKRRLNLPAFDVPEYRDPAVGYVNSKDIKDSKNFISRQAFPQNEMLVNKAKYDAGVLLLGAGKADNTASNIWWDVDANYCTSNNQ